MKKIRVWIMIGAATFVVAALVVHHQLQSTPSIPAKAGVLNKEWSVDPRLDEVEAPKAKVEPGAEGANAKNGMALQAEFYRTRDLAAFVRKASQRALDAHDGRAAFLVSEALKTCSLVAHQFKQDPNADQNWDINYSKIAPKAPNWLRDKTRRDFDRCVDLVRDDVFADLPPKGGGYRDPSYWYSLATDSNDLYVQVHEALLAVNSVVTNEQRNQVTASAQLSIEAAVQSGDPSAMFLAGQLLANGRVSQDTLAGVGLSLAACELGYDCSAENPGNSFYTCRESGTCPADADYAYFAQQTLGAAAYAIAYSDAQSFKEALKSGNWETAKSLLSLSRIDASNHN
jgi:hypothetical protein